MNQLLNFDLIQRQDALNRWVADCTRRMSLRFPKINFEANHWPIKALYQTPQRDWYFTEPFKDFTAKDQSYRVVLRCLVAEMVIAGSPKFLTVPIEAFRTLSSASAHSVFDLTIQDLRKIEKDCMLLAKANPPSANKIQSSLATLTRLIVQLAGKGVIPRLGYNVDAKVKAELRNMEQSARTTRRDGKVDILDRKIEAFNEALNALIDNDPRLNAMDRVAICALTRELCAPSRINEVLCSSIDDHIAVEDYVQHPVAEEDATHRAHQMLLVTMKGSKGAEWSAKPVLNFMIDAFQYVTDVILTHGKRSRMLVEWYQKNPTKLFLPPELEYLRGQNLSREALAKVIYQTENPRPESYKSAPKTYFNEVKQRQFKVPNPDTLRKNGTLNSRSTITVLAWTHVEELLLKKVHQAMTDCRKVTPQNYYEGDLSKMLFLFDRDRMPYLPYAAYYKTISMRLKRTDTDKKAGELPSLFEKLGITMPINGRIQVAELDSHDPRRWLTTMALRHGDKLSDVLINKWANRSKLSQLKAYDFRTAEDLADFSRMPEAPELTDLSNGLTLAQKLEDEFGLKTAIVAVHSAGISATSMNQVLQAVEDRPVAKTSRGIIIIYPQRFGICLHQHHETPCRNYSNSCLPCNDGAVVKGHIPTNEAIRERDGVLFKSIVGHLENLAQTHNRRVADDQDALGAHMLTLVKNGLNEDQMEQAAAHLIREFHEIKHLIKDKLLANRLHEAFVARGYVQILDDPSVSSGALLKYHNPTQHAAPGLEMALDTHGGREQVAHDEQALIEQFPQFAPKVMGLKDQRHLLEADEEEEED